MSIPTSAVPSSSAVTHHDATSIEGDEITPHAAHVAALALKEVLWQDPTAQYLEQRAEALRLARQSGDEALYAELLLMGFLQLHHARRLTEAEAALTEAKMIFERLQDTIGLAVWRMYSGYSPYVQGDMVTSVARVREALPLLTYHPDPRHRARAIDWLAGMLSNIGLYDAAQEIVGQQKTAAEIDQPLFARFRRRAILLDLELRFLKLRRRYGWYTLPPGDPEVQALLQEVAAVQTMFAEAPEGSDKYLAVANYTQYLIHAGHYAQAQTVWTGRRQAWKVASPIPLIGICREAELALFCDHDYGLAIALVQPLLANLINAEPINYFYCYAVLAQAHYKSGDYKAAYDAQRQFYERSMQLANNNAQTQAALLGLELKAEREKLQSQQALVHAGKLVAVGQLASSLAHEINQPAATLLLLARQLKSDLGSQQWGELAQGIDDVGHLTERLSQLVIRLKNFARDEPVHLQLLSLREVLERAHGLVQPRLKISQVQYHAEIPAGLYIRADQERLCLALINIINNAIDALNGQSSPAPEIRLTAHTDAEAGEVHLHVSDNGPGLSEEAQSKLFEPFYTTKPIGQGLGLGLTITKEALDSMQARVYACNASAPDRGVAVTVVLVAAMAITEARMHHDGYAISNPV
jgi:signal transduction histidine kinase